MTSISGRETSLEKKTKHPISKLTVMMSGYPCLHQKLDYETPEVVYHGYFAYRRAMLFGLACAAI